ncbi:MULTISPECIES: hypothetical protein [Nostocales]|uniref:Uncharacterized protein n=2 Tax=Nostocales TaxID=1161 RepID=A0ABW8WXH7_9CYAN|nr:hypothetical protein [Tolypothrix bouteillei]
MKNKLTVSSIEFEFSLSADGVSSDVCSNEVPTPTGTQYGVGTL